MRSAGLISRLKQGLRTILGPLLPLVRSIRTFPERQRAKELAAALKCGEGLSVCYLTSQFPVRPALRSEMANGGAVKLTFLAEHFPHSYPRASLLYTVSSVDHSGKTEIVRQTKQNGLKIVLNQNGVSYPAWGGKNWDEANAKMREVFKLADFIVFQSEFCRQGALKFLGDCTCPYQIIYNPVDIDLYQPAEKHEKKRGPVLLLGGNQYEKYRFESALESLRETLILLPDSSLIVTGRLWGEDQQASMEAAHRMLHNLNLVERVKFTGIYTQDSAPEIFQRADILLHTKYNDPSPNLIAEALASGLPVVYSASGGVPELTGPDAGVGIPVDISWDKISTPDPREMALGVQKVWENLPSYSEAARQRAVEKFSLDNFVTAHRELFARLLK